MKNTDPNAIAKALREQRLPIVAECKTKHWPSWKIAAEVTKRTGQTVTDRTIRKDWELCMKRWREESAVNTPAAIDEAVRECDEVIAELWELYNHTKEPRKVKNSRVKSFLTKIDGFGNHLTGKDDILNPPVPVESEASSRSEVSAKDGNPVAVGDVRIIAEIRAWTERRDKLLGLQKYNVDITTGGKTFNGFSAVIPDVPGIVEICRQIDAEREERERERDGE